MEDHQNQLQMHFDRVELESGHNQKDHIGGQSWRDFGVLGGAEKAIKGGGCASKTAERGGMWEKCTRKLLGRGLSLWYLNRGRKRLGKWPRGYRGGKGKNDRLDHTTHSRGNSKKRHTKSTLVLVVIQSMRGRKKGKREIWGGSIFGGQKGGGKSKMNNGWGGGGGWERRVESRKRGSPIKEYQVQRSWFATSVVSTTCKGNVIRRKK